jgi:hypothetical protein
MGQLTAPRLATSLGTHTPGQNPAPPPPCRGCNVHAPISMVTHCTVSHLTQPHLHPAPSSCTAHKHACADRAVSAPWLHSRWCTPCRCWLPPAMLLLGHQPGPGGSRPPCWHPGHMHRQAGRQAGAQTGTQTDRQAGRQAGRQKNTYQDQDPDILKQITCLLCR